jgi:hypothetical protein
MEMNGWLDSLPSGPLLATPRFDPSVRTAGEIAGSGVAWPQAAPERMAADASAHQSAA